MTGYEDLDQYGDWSYVAGYGPVWRPRVVVAGWAPYRFGHWIWVGPWGWTWVADEPWGFAPFHYGRWAFAGTSWVWVPGPSVVRPVYAPALVAWVGGGPGAFSFGAGIGWSPLAPGEVFVPGYRVSRAYVNRVNITNTTVNVTRITNVYNTVVINRSDNSVTYANRGVNGGVTVVSHDTFVNARSVARNVVSVPARELASAPVMHASAVEPVRSSVMGAGSPVARKPPAAVTSRTVVALRTPAPMPHSFDQRQAQAGGRLNEQSSLVRQQSPGRPVTAPNQAARQPPLDRGQLIQAEIDAAPLAHLREQRAPVDPARGVEAVQERRGIRDRLHRVETTRQILAARAGDAEAAAIWLRSVHRLACGLVSLINVLDPEVAILGGGITGALAAYYMTLEGLDTVLLDRRPVACGSTAASARIERNDGSRRPEVPEGQSEEREAYAVAEKADDPRGGNGPGSRPGRPKGKRQGDVHRSGDQPFHHRDVTRIGQCDLSSEVVVDAPCKAGGDDRKCRQDCAKAGFSRPRQRRRACDKGRR